MGIAVLALLSGSMLCGAADARWMAGVARIEQRILDAVKERAASLGAPVQ